MFVFIRFDPLFIYFTDDEIKGTVIFDLELAPEDYMGILSHLAIIALIIKRFVEIFENRGVFF